MTIYYTQASAGSGKTTSIEQIVTDKLINNKLEPNQIMAVTFTKDAAAELKERISQSLIAKDKLLFASSIMTSPIGTVHSVSGQLLVDFAFELGLSPEQQVIDPADTEQILSEALESSLDTQRISRLNELGNRLNITDWRTVIHDLIQLSRSNNFSAEDMSAFAESSINDLIEVLPSIDPGVNESEFRLIIQQAIEAGRILDKPTKGLSSAIEDCEKILRQPSLNWQNWIKLSKLNPTKMGEAILAQTKQFGASILQCQLFQDELFNFIREIFSATAIVLEDFKTIKQKRGLIDFVDQEQLALHALNMPTIQERIKEEIRFLIIDEFQDTNPIQLALFSKLSSLVDDTLMVGDAKQAIYGFRGSDPKLALNVLDFVQKGGGEISTLSNSYRSRQGLVALTNELFTQPFSSLLTPEQVQLTPARKDKLSTADVEWWTLVHEGRLTKTIATNTLAKGIKEHILDGIEIMDKETKKHRPATWGDMAVLCRSNSEVAELASCLANMGVPVSIERSGLLETPEISLALACLRHLIDPFDSLASAEILCLAGNTGPESWLEDRLNAMENAKVNVWDERAHPIFNELSQVRKQISLLSTSEALDLAIITADVYSIIAAWEEDTKLAEHRFANLKALTEFVNEYENHCESQYLAATPSGFILWLKNKEQNYLDNQAANPGDAITLTTYHGSKGLEWPIVVCSSLDSPIKLSLYGIRTVQENADFDWNNPLKGRSIRYIPNPFPDQKGNDPLNDLLKQLADWGENERQEINEAIQLLYVGMTRARDQLILPTLSKRDYLGEWLKLLDSPLLPLQEGSVQLDSYDLRVKSKTILHRVENQVLPTERRAKFWFNPECRISTSEKILFNQPASKCLPTESAQGNIIHNFDSRIKLNGSVEMEEVGVALHHCFALLINNPEIDPLIVINILNNHIPGIVNPDDVVARAKELLNWIKLKFPVCTIYPELPFTLQLANGGIRQGSMDLVIDTCSGWYIIDHKSNPQPSSNWVDIALQYSGQLAAYKHALEALSNRKVLGTFIHFTIGGGLVELNI
ncbi:UvrD-helicase domain-containing protein [Legionella pneumophila serogroup 1]